MSDTFKHHEIEKKWQTIWEEQKIFQAEYPSKKPKFYALDMFPYPSGQGLHVGHLASYLPNDIVARFKKAKGFNVLHPMGYDAFGLPAEQYAIQTGVHPQITTEKAIENFRRQLKSFGFSFDWSKELATTEPEFFKWTQFIFTELFKNNLAYQKEVPVNWCPALKTVLANEEVVDGKSERGGHPVERVPMKQWMLKITDYAEKLLKGLDSDALQWPHRTVQGQKNWIGKSTGAKVFFKLKTSTGSLSNQTLEVYTTRPDTLFGATFMVLAPEHPLVKEITTKDCKESVEAYIKKASLKSEIQRQADTEKTGVFTGGFAVNPVNNEEIPVWISDYVLMDYGTGAIMSVPAHDQRDYDFATKFNLPIKQVLKSDEALPFSSDGEVINSDFLNGFRKDVAIKKAIEHLEQTKTGEKEIQYKLRDWLFSRQRYWGEPIPIIHKTDGSKKALDLKDLPLLLPEVADYEPTEDGEAPLKNNTEWINTPEGPRESHTMPGSAGSSWYFLRYPDHQNQNELCSKEKLDYWLPVDLYVGGPEHTVGHLLYSRFWTKFLYDLGYLSFDEPYLKLAHQGMILGEDGEKMSKSRGNVINPDDVKEEYGVDAVRVYIAFMGPFEKEKPWNTKGIEGSRRFLDRVFRLCVDENQKSKLTQDPLSDSLISSVHKTIKKVTEDIEAMSFNTAVSAMMILVNDLYKEKSNSERALKPLLKLLSPFAPHISQEIWSIVEPEEKLLAQMEWPVFDENYCKEDLVEMGVQVNGKMRGTIHVSENTTEAEALELSYKVQNINDHLSDKNIVKIIYKPLRILNIIVKG